MNKNAYVAPLVLLPLFGQAAGQNANPPGDKPNIIYILADDLGYAELGAYGQTRIETPNIDLLAKSGMLFTNHYSGSAVSAPSRCSLLTGLHTGHSYIRGNDELSERGNVWSHKAMLEDPGLEGQRPLPAGTVTFAKLLKQDGYATACVGKWGLGYPGSEGEPNQMGFDLFYGYSCQRQAHTYYPPFLYRNTKREYLNNRVVEISTRLDSGANPLDDSSYAAFNQKEYSPDKMFAEIISFVETGKNRPFMLFWATTIPHVSLQAPKRWVDYYVGKFDDEQPYLGQKGYFPTRYPRATYAAMVSYLDEQVGLLVAKLKKLGIYNNTVIVLTSDNGPSFAGGTDSPWFDSAKPFKSDAGWGKGSLHEGGIRVPLIVAWPAKIKPGTSSSHISAAWDMFATICDVANVAAPATDGISLLPVLLGQKQKKHEYLYWEYPEGSGSKAVRMGKWKGLITGIKKGNSSMELFDLEADPLEQNSITGTNPKVEGKIRAIMRKAHKTPAVKAFEM